MSLVNLIPSVIHEAPDADFSAYTYYQIFSTSAVTATINGVPVLMNPDSGLILTLKISSISATNGVFLLGSPMNVTTGVSYAGTESAPQLGGSAFL